MTLRRLSSSATTWSTSGAALPGRLPGWVAPRGAARSPPPVTVAKEDFERTFMRWLGAVTVASL